MSPGYCILASLSTELGSALAGDRRNGWGLRVNHTFGIPVQIGLVFHMTDDSSSSATLQALQIVPHMILFIRGP